MEMEFKIVPLANGKFNVMLINLKQCFVVEKVEDVEWKNVGEETQKLLKRFF